MNVRGLMVPVWRVAGLTLAFSSLLAAQEAAKRSDAANDKLSDDKPFTIQVEVNRVLVPVVVRDKQGRYIDDLKKEDFQIFSDNKPQPLSGFMIERRLPTTHVEGQQQSATARTGPQRFLVFLFDDTHLNFSDLSRVQKASRKVLDEAVTGSDIAAVMSLSGKTNSGLTRDHARLNEAIMALKPQNLFASDGGECPNIDFYQADLIENKHDATAYDVAVQQTFSCQPSLDPTRDMGTAQRLAESSARRALNLGLQDSQSTFANLLEIVRRMAKLPGQSTLILISPGFQTITAEAMSQESHIMDVASEANLTISALDARGLYTTEFGASQRAEGSGNSMRIKATYARSSAFMAENVMSELADSTGGTFFHNSNDLSGGFKTIADPPECMYMLQFTPDMAKPDGAYHHLKIKVNRDGVQTQARHGFFSPKPAKQKK